MSKPLEIIRNGIIDNNPVFMQVIGMCPTMAVTTSAENGVGMGLASTAVLMCSNLVISLIRKFIPNEVRIPVLIVTIASFVTAVEMILKAYVPSLNNALGIYIPLITVNCIILSRAESFAIKNNPLDSLLDGVGMGIGFTLVLVAIGALREILGAGTIFGFEILPEAFPRSIIMILAPGGFFTLAFLIAGFNYIRKGMN